VNLTGVFEDGHVYRNSRGARFLCVQVTAARASFICVGPRPGYQEAEPGTGRGGRPRVVANPDDLPSPLRDEHGAPAAQWSTARVTILAERATPEELADYHEITDPDQVKEVLRLTLRERGELQ